jgi:hypothetical protein
MIPFAYINEWRDVAPWDAQAMVEQDLILSRIVVDLFSDPFLREALIFRGGTALNKLCFPRPLRYSEDVDLVQREEGPIGPVFDAVRRALGGWLGEKPARKQGPGVVNLVYRAGRVQGEPGRKTGSSRFRRGLRAPAEAGHGVRSRG